jgi:putative ABC transport system permease protein
MDGENLERVREVEGVELAAPQVFLASLKADCCSVKIQVIGFDPDTDFFVRPWIEQSHTRELGDLDVVVGSKVESDVGEIIRIYDERCKVVGRLAATGTGLDTAVYCNLSTMKTLLAAAEEKGVSHKVSSDESDDRISAIYVKVKDGYDIGQVNSKIQGHTRKCSAVRTKSMLTDVSDSLSAISGTVATLIGAIWLLALVILVVAFVMIANERKREFAVLRLLGTSRTMLGGMVLKESALCSLAGGILGVLTASMLVFPFTTLIETSLGLPYLIPSAGTILALALASLTATVLAGALASSWASFRLSRVDPGTVLREGN